MTTARHHVLLVGIDDYRTQPLRGCVNDIDAVQRVLLERMSLPGDCIRRLVSPNPGHQPTNPSHAPAVAEQPATLANVRHALAELATRQVARNDRVFIYYAGHGASVAVQAGGGRTYHRQALVMADHDPARPDSGMLFDHDLEEALRAIREQTSSIALVLDCCHAGGVTRRSAELLPPEVLASTDPVARCLELDAMAAVPDPCPTRASADARPRPLIEATDHCHVVAACLGYERANEENGSDGVRNGLLTRAFVDALADIPDGALRDVTWSRIWQRVHADVSQRNPAQHPRMAGNAGRAVFAGPPVDHDPGIPVSRNEHTFEIAAGTLANITKNAVLAIYDDQPPYFQRLGSAEDLRDRIGLVRVDTATPATATAVIEGGAFELPPGARGRLIQAGESARLRCAVTPPHPDIEAQLRKSPLLEVVSPSDRPVVRLELDRGRWFVTDQLYSTRADRPVLFALQPNELYAARQVLEHYCAYSLPLRMAAQLTDLPSSLALHVRIPPDPRSTSANMMPGANSQHIAATTFDTYVLRAGARVCFEVRNHSAHSLRVTLVNSAASGKVQFLGDTTIAANEFHTFDGGNREGAFQMVLPPGLHHGLDRLIVIGRRNAHDLGYLRVDRTFADVVNAAREALAGPRIVTRGGDQDHRPLVAPPGARQTTSPLEQWTVAQAIIETRG
jgi:Caspase domain